MNNLLLVLWAPGARGRLRIAVASLALACLTGVALGRVELQKDVSATVPARDVEVIRIDFQVASLEITTHEAEEIRVGGHIRARGQDRLRTRTALDQAELIVEPGRRTTLGLTRPRREVQFMAELKIGLPRGRNLEIDVNVGEIDAQLELPRSSKWEMAVGDVDLRLPRETAARFKAEVQVGDINLRGLPGDVRVERRHLVGAQAEGVIGDPQRAADYRIEITVNVGSVRLRAVEAGGRP